MDKNLTKIVLLIDRSGSMGSIKRQAETGINEFIQEQKDDPTGRTNITVIDFDTKYEEVYSGDIQNVPKYHLKPRGMTALYDSIGRAITETKAKYTKRGKHLRPGLVIFAIVTDGMNNASYKYTADSIQELTTHMTSEYDWQFVYLGANQDAVAVGRSMGISSKTSATFKGQNYGNALKSVSSNVSKAKRSLSAGKKVDLEFSLNQLESMTE